MRNVIARASTYLFGGVVAQAVIFCMWLALPWFLTPAEVGYVSLALFAVEFLTMLSLAGMDAALIRFAARTEGRESILFITMVIAGGAFMLMAVFTYAVLKIGIPILDNTLTWVSAHFVLVIVAVAANVAWSLYQSYQVAAKQAREYAVFQLVRAVLYFGIGIGGLAFFGHEASMVVGAAAVSSLGILVLLLLSRKQFVLPKNATQMADISKILSYGLPLMLNGALGVVVVYTQRIVIDQYADIYTLGIFAFFSAIATQLNGFWAGFNKAWTPEFFTLIENDSAQSIKLLQGVLVLVGAIYPLLLAVYVVLSEAFVNSLFFRAAYAAHADILYLLLLALLFNGLYAVAYPLYYYGLKTYRIVAISMFLAGSNLLISVFAIRHWGMVGAAISSVLLSIITSAIYLLCYRRWAEGEKRLALTLLAIVILAMAAAVILVMTHSAWMFASTLLSISAVTWGIGGYLARPLLRRFFSQEKSSIVHSLASLRP
jgi:O-antigen/teichoic acid export membrane protein